MRAMPSRPDKQLRLPMTWRRINYESEMAFLGIRHIDALNLLPKVMALELSISLDVGFVRASRRRTQP
jgi:hypothetical protein